MIYEVMSSWHLQWHILDDLSSRCEHEKKSEPVLVMKVSSHSALTIRKSYAMHIPLAPQPLYLQNVALCEYCP